MAIGPINYTGQQAQLDVDPLFALARQLEQRRAIRAEEEQRAAQIDLAQRKFDAEQAREGEWSSAVGSVLANPTTEGFQNLFRFTDKIDAAKQLLGNYTDAQRNRNLTAAMEVGGLLNAGNNDLALKKLQDRRVALVNAGESTEITDSIIADIESGDPARINRARGVAGTVIATSVDPEKAGALLDRLGYSATYQLDREKFEESRRHNLVSEGHDAARVDLSRAAGARAAAKGKGGKSGGYSDAQLDALLQ
jgi:hypothetical protein